MEEFHDAYRRLGWILAAGVALYLVKLALAIALKGRVAPGLAPSPGTAGRPEAAAQFISLIGHSARPAEVMGTVRLQATIGLKLAFLGGLALFAALLWELNSPVPSPESGLFALYVLAMVQAFRLEIIYDRDTITLPRWWFGRTTHRWRDLLAVRGNDPWFLTFTFHKGPTIRVHKYIVGNAQLLETAQRHMREV